MGQISCDHAAVCSTKYKNRYNMLPVIPGKWEVGWTQPMKINTYKNHFALSSLYAYLTNFMYSVYMIKRGLYLF
jgi:hypothetical protein